MQRRSLICLVADVAPQSKRAVVMMPLQTVCRAVPAGTRATAALDVCDAFTEAYTLAGFQPPFYKSPYI